MDRFFDYNQDQLFLLPPSLDDWVPENHLARFIDRTVLSLDLSAFLSRYAPKGERGGQAYHPAMMLKVILYCFCCGVFSSRKMERMTYDNVGARFLAANQFPDHSSFANFRKRHLEDISDVFIQVVALCREMGLVKLGHVSIDGSLIKSNASRRKNIAPKDIDELLEQAETVVKDLTARWESEDAAEEADSHTLPQELLDAKLQADKLHAVKEAFARREAKNNERYNNRLESQMCRKGPEPEPDPQGDIDPGTLRKELGMTQQQLSDLTGVSRSRISDLEIGRAPLQR